MEESLDRRISELERRLTGNVESRLNALELVGFLWDFFCPMCLSVCLSDCLWNTLFAVAFQLCRI
jgi:hypothetical protein